MNRRSLKRLNVLLMVCLLISVSLSCSLSTFTSGLPAFKDLIKDLVKKLPITQKLDEETLERLTILWGGSLQMQPGQEQQMEVGTVECCYVFQAQKADVTWSVSPSQGTSIDPKSGLFSVDAATPSGSVYTVTADIENGRRLLTLDIYVYTPEANPLAGVWHEEIILACSTYDELQPEVPIGELVFSADGTFSVTWLPFEIYKDYWGTYTFDLQSGTLDLTVEGGNYTPPDIDPSGYFSFDADGSLRLSDLWLGTAQELEKASQCGHLFYTYP